jgi:hypothetical protein
MLLLLRRGKIFNRKIPAVFLSSFAGQIHFTGFALFLSIFDSRCLQTKFALKKTHRHDHPRLMSSILNTFIESKCMVVLEKKNTSIEETWIFSAQKPI